MNEAAPDSGADPLGPTEAAVLGEAVTIALATGRRIVDPGPLQEACAARGIDHDAWYAAMEALAAMRLLRMRTMPPSQVQLLSTLDAGVFHHLAATRPEMPQVEAAVWRAVTDAPLAEAVALHEHVGEPALLVEMLLDRWVMERRVVYSKAPGRRFRIHRLLPST